MKMLKMFVIIVVMLIGNVVYGDQVYIAQASGGSGNVKTIHDAARLAGTDKFILKTADFTVDGNFLDNVWAIVFSDMVIDGEFVTDALNGYGYSYDYGSAPGEKGFKFVMYGDDSTTVQASQVVFILNDDSLDLFWRNEETGYITVGLGDDIVLWQESVSIDGGPLGDISKVFYAPGPHGSLSSVELVSPPPVVTLLYPGYNLDNVDPNTSLEWENNAGSSYDVYLYTDPNNPELISSDVVGGTLDVSDYLDWYTIYYWSVDEVVDGVVVASSDDQAFRTIDYECSGGLLVGDLNGDCAVDLVDFALLAGNWLVEVPKVPLGSGG